MLSRSALGVAFALALAATSSPRPGVAQGQVYKHVDAQGRVTYSNAPVEPGYELQFGAKPTPLDPKLRDPAAPLLNAASAGDLGEMRTLLDQGANPNRAERRHQQTPLHRAVHAMRNAPAATAMLLAAGADPNARMYGRSAPLHVTRDPEVARLLLEAGAEIEAADQFKRTPLHTAIASNQARMTEFLVARGARLNARDHAGNTPLLEAALKNRVDTARMLIERGARLDARNHRGDSAMHFAARNGSTEMVGLLLEKNAPVNLYDKTRRTPLDFASTRPEIAALLQGRGAFRGGGPKPPPAGPQRAVPPAAPGEVPSGGGMDEETVSYEYDDPGRLKRVTRDDSLTTYEYDERSNVSRRTHDGVTRRYEYDDSNQLRRMWDE